MIHATKDFHNICRAHGLRHLDSGVENMVERLFPIFETCRHTILSITSDQSALAIRNKFLTMFDATSRTEAFGVGSFTQRFFGCKERDMI